MEKRYFKMISILLISILIFSGCKDNPKEEEVDVNTNTQTQNDTQSKDSGTENSKATESADASETTVPTNVAVEPVSNIPSQTEAIGDESPVSRGLVAKMLALTFYDQNTIDNMPREITFTDTSPDKWYDKYINAVCQGGYMQGIGDGTFKPEQPMTLSQAQELMNSLNLDNKVKVEMTEETKDMPISYALWTDIYKKFLENFSGEKTIKEAYNIDEKTFTVLATPENNSQLKNWNMITDKGPASYDGLNMEPYIDKSIKVLQKGDEVIAVLSVESQTPTIENAYVVENSKEDITIFSGGAERTYDYKCKDEDYKGKICDITIAGDKATNVVFKDEKINDYILKSNYNEIELKNNGTLEVGENFKVYSLADGNVKWKSLSDLIVGTNVSDLFIFEGKVCAAVIKEKAPCDKIRVAINNSDFSSLYHQNVSITCDTAFTVTNGLNVVKYNGGDVVDITKDTFTDANRIYVAPDLPEGRLQITSITRNYPGNESPKYRGTLEISNTDEGLNVVNVLGMEEYLYSVIPSEMPSSYGVEASKVQAITARSYAYNQYYANRYHGYGANVDDSVSCQVYNNIPENDVSIAAANETIGQCLTYDGDVIVANFFSTSCGYTSNGGEVWPHYKTKQFPTISMPYLQSLKQYEGEDFGDLTVEENFVKFIKARDLQGYDSYSPWFRWYTEMTAAEMTASINANLANRYWANPTLIKTLQPDNVYRSVPIETIGDLVTMEVTKRGEGGIIMEMKIVGTKATILVSSEYNVRALLAPKQYIEGGEDIIVARQDGSKLVNYSLMPSAFFTMERMTNPEGQIEYVKFYGGGNGHGVGMSQNGVKGMIDAGHKFDQILVHYYPGTEIVKMY